MEFTDQDRKDLKNEIDHIFDSGANDIRLSEMMERFLDRKKPSEMEVTYPNQEVNYPEIGGVYKHYKGGVYKIMTMATHSESDEKLVIYQSVLFGSIHARPLESWNEKVSIKANPVYFNSPLDSKHKEKIIERFVKIAI